MSEGLTSAIRTSALALGPGPGASSGWLALLGFSLASTVTSQGYRSLATLNMVPWRTVAPAKAVGVAAAAIMNLILFGNKFGIALDKEFIWRIPHSMALVMQAPWLAAMSISQLHIPGKFNSMLASFGMMATLPTAMTIVDVGLNFKKPEFQNAKSAFTMLSFTTNALSVATAYVIMYGAFGLRNALVGIAKTVA